MKTFVFDRIERSLEEQPVEKVLECLVRPAGLLVVMSAYNDVLGAFRDRVRSVFGEQAPKAAWVRESRYSTKAARELVSEVAGLVAAPGNGGGSVLALCDQPWPVIDDAFEASANEYKEMLRAIERGNGRATYAYVTSDAVSLEKARERYERWAEEYKDLPALSLEQRAAFFGLSRFDTVTRQGWKDEWKPRLGECREKYCTAVLHTLAGVAKDLAANRPGAWRLFALALMADFEKKDDPRALARIVEEGLQPGTKGWGHDPALKPNAEERVGLVRVKASAECVEWLAKRQALPRLLPALFALVPSPGALGVLARCSRSETKLAGLLERIQAVEQMLRETRNRIEHDEGMPSPLYFNAIKLMTTALEEFSWQASAAAPTWERWSLSDEAWKRPLSQLTGARANELAKRARNHLIRTYRLNHLQEPLSNRRLTVRELNPSLNGAKALLAMLPALDREMAAELARESEWEEWNQLAATDFELRRSLAESV